MTDMLASDLAALRDHNRRDLTSVTESLRSGIYRDDRAGVEARRDELAKVRRAELATMPLTLAHIFAHRMGRAAAGAAATLGVFAAIVVAATPSLLSTLSWHLMWLPFSTMAMTFGAIVLGVYVTATFLAEGYFARRMRNSITANGDAHSDLDRLAEGPIAVGQHLVRRIDGWTAGLSIAGLTSMIGLAAFILFFDTASRHYFALWPNRALAIGGGLQHNVDLIGSLLFVFCVPAFFVGRAADDEHRGHRSHWLRLVHFVVPLAGSLAAFITVRGGIEMARTPRIPHMEERAVLVLAGLTSIFACVSWLVLRWRRREMRKLEG